MKKEYIQKFWELVDKYDKFLLCLHVNADADSLCSNVAMSELLTARGKTVTILAGKNDDFSPELHGLADWLRHVLPSRVEDLNFNDYDCFIMLDAHSEERLYDMKNMPLPKIIVDHHEGNVITNAELAIVDPAYSSASQMVFELGVAHGPFTTDYLLAVYMGIYSDTAGFRYGVSDRVHGIAELICQRIDVSGTVLAYNKSIGTADIAILSIALNNIVDFSVSGIRFYVSLISQKDIKKKFGILDVYWNSNIAIRTLSDISEADVLCVASEIEPQVWRVRFRSFIDDGKHAKLMAESFGGGGHAKAASGSFLNNEPRAVIAAIKDHAQKIFG